MTHFLSPSFLSVVRVVRRLGRARSVHADRRIHDRLADRRRRGSRHGRASPARCRAGLRGERARLVRGRVWPSPRRVRRPSGDNRQSLRRRRRAERERGRVRNARRPDGVARGDRVAPRRRRGDVRRPAPSRLPRGGRSFGRTRRRWGAGGKGDAAIGRRRRPDDARRYDDVAIDVAFHRPPPPPRATPPAGLRPQRRRSLGRRRGGGVGRRYAWTVRRLGR